MKEILITFPDGSTKSYPQGTTYETISKDYPGKYAYVAAKVDNVIFSLDDKVENDSNVSFVDFMDTSGHKIYQNGIKFVFEVSLKRLYPDFEVHFLHSHPKGMYAEIKGDHILTESEIQKIKSMMSNVVSSNLSIRKYNVSKKDAFKYYEEQNYYEKSRNIQNFNESVVTFYVLDNFVNYYYSEMPNKTKTMSLYNVKYLGNNKIVFLLPSKLTYGRVPEYVNYDGIINSYEESKDWLNILNMEYLADLNDDVSNGKILDFIDVSELKFNDEIRNVVKKICEKPDIRFVMVAGPSSSGKTTTTRRLKSYLECCGYKPIVVSTDDYFMDRAKTPKDDNGKYDFECLHALNIEKLNQDIKDLVEGKEVTFPVYDFVSGTGSKNGKKIKFENNSIVLIEGLHSLNDDLLPIISNENKFKIYISPFIGLNIDRHNYISTTDLRLVRRIVRDNRTRGKKVEDTIAYWETVRSGEVKYIFPYIHQADVILNTALNYEIGVLRVYIEPLLLSVKIDSPYYEEARRLISFLKEFHTIPSEYVRKDSILREFIGGEI